MSTMQRLTLIGMFNYNPKLFDALSLPEQYDKDVFIDSLLIEHGEKLVLYSDIDFMAYAIGAWGRKWSMELTRIAEALQAEYNPIWNYDRYEEADDINNRTKTADSISDNDNTSETTSAGGSTSKSDTVDFSTSDTKSSSETTSSSDSASTGNNEKTVDLDSSMNADDTSHKDSVNNADFDVTRENVTNGTKEYQVSADNESDYQPERKEISDIGKQKETTDGTKDDIKEDNTSHHTEDTKTNTKEEEQTNQSQNVLTNENSQTNENNQTNNVNNVNITNTDNSGSSTTSHGGGSSKSNEGEDFASHHGAHLWGNVGVTTSASMVTEVVQQRMKYNLYNTACRLFANELLIGIY